MTVWLAAAALAALVAFAVVFPLLRGPRTSQSRRAFDIAVYKDQLVELERDRARGVLTEAEVAATRTEIERRLLHAAEADAAEPTHAASGRGGLALAGLIGLLVPLGALGLYGYLGAPGVPSVPLAERPAVQGSGDIAVLVEQLARRLRDNPENPEGWLLLGRTYRTLSRFQESAEAFGQAIARGVEDAETLTSYGEMLTAAAQGSVTPKAQAAFGRALALDPADPKARYYHGLTLVQQGGTAEALEVWLALAADTPTDAPWRGLLEQQIQAAAAALDRPVGDIPVAAAPPGPTAADVEAAGDLSPEERMAFIRSMVDRLAARLEEEPDDLDGWLRLARAYTVLGETDKAAASIDRAQALARDLPADAPQRQAVEAARQALPQSP